MSEVVAYCRVSTVGQSNSGQIDNINKYCENLGLKLTRQIEQQISSRKEKSKRLAWLDELSSGDILLVAELSRLGRSMSELILTIKEIENKGIELHVIDRKLLIKKGNQNLESTIMLGLFSLLAEVERSLISERTKRGLAASTKKSGRPRGTKYNLEEICEELNNTEFIQNVAEKLKVPGTSIRALIKSKYLVKVDELWTVA